MKFLAVEAEAGGSKLHELSVHRNSLSGKSWERRGFANSEAGGGLVNKSEFLAPFWNHQCGMSMRRRPTATKPGLYDNVAKWSHGSATKWPLQNDTHLVYRL